MHHLLHPLPLAAGLPPPSRTAPLPLVPLSSVFPIASPSRCHPSASLPPCCGSRSQSHGLFASLSVPCPSQPAMSCVVVGQTTEAQCSPPPSSLSTSSQLLIRAAAMVGPTGPSVHRRCGALASCMHRPCPLPSALASSVSPSFASLAPMPHPILICTPVLPLLVSLPQHWIHPMAHVASRTLAVVPPPRTTGPATSTRVCAQWRGMSVWGSARCTCRKIPYLGMFIC